MEPTILAGDHFFVSTSNELPKRKEIVVYRQNGQVYIKRVVGLPGDTLEMRGGVLVVDGDSVREPYARHAGEESVSDPDFEWQRRFVPGFSARRVYHPTLTFWGPILIPTGKYFLLGDNRGYSADSRYGGFVEARDIFARPGLIYFSKDRQSGDVRWSRIARAIPDST